MALALKLFRAMRPPAGIAFRLRRGDGVNLVAVSAALVGMLSVLYFGIPYLRPEKGAGSGDAKSPREASVAAEEAIAAEMRRIATERQVGSIVFVTQSGLCEEIRFNNVTEQILSIERVDCENRLTRANPQEAQEAKKKAERMRDVLTSFRR